MSTKQDAIREAGENAFTVSANELRAKALIDRLGLSRRDNGRIAINDRPSNLLSKQKPDCTTQSKPLTTYFVAANAVLAGVTAYLARLKFRPLDVVFLAGVICLIGFWRSA
jgi:hypothetical protein